MVYPDPVGTTRDPFLRVAEEFPPIAPPLPIQVPPTTGGHRHLRPEGPCSRLELPPKYDLTTTIVGASGKRTLVYSGGIYSEGTLLERGWRVARIMEGFVDVQDICHTERRFRMTFGTSYWNPILAIGH